MDEVAPNIRLLDEKGRAVAYDHVGPSDSLRVMYKAKSKGGWLEYSPANVAVWINGQPLQTLQKLVFTIDKSDPGVPNIPIVEITLKLNEIDIDADTLTALEAIVKTKSILEQAASHKEHA